MLIQYFNPLYVYFALEFSIPKNTQEYKIYIPFNAVNQIATDTHILQADTRLRILVHDWGP